MDLKNLKKVSRREFLAKSGVFSVSSLLCLMTPKFLYADDNVVGSSDISSDDIDNRIIFIKTLDGDISVIKDGKEVITVNQSNIIADKLVSDANNRIVIGSEGIDLFLSKDGEKYLVNSLAYNSFIIKFTNKSNDFIVLNNDVEIFSRLGDSYTTGQAVVSEKKGNITLSKDSTALTYNKFNNSILSLTLEHKK